MMQRSMSVLLDEEYRRSFVLDFVDRLEDRVNNKRREAQRRLVKQEETRL